MLLEPVRSAEPPTNSGVAGTSDFSYQPGPGTDLVWSPTTAQTSLLGAQQTAVSLRLQQLTAEVQLIEALGGGWDGSQLPTSKDVASRSTLRP